MTKRRRQTQRPKRNVTPWLIGGGIIAVLVVALLISLNTGVNAGAGASGNSSLDTCGSQTCGQANAPVTIDIYSDFQ